MARPRTIDRDHLLLTAEALVTCGSAASLTFGSLAAAAGMSKASVQSVFGTREALIDAMIDRALGAEQARFDAVAGSDPDLRDRIMTHVAMTAEEIGEGSRFASLVAASAGSGDQIASAVQWYSRRADGFRVETHEDRRLRVAFLATEGAFYIRHLVGFPMANRLWAEIFSDIAALAQPRDEKD